MVDLINSYIVALWELTLEMSPYLLLGFLIAGVLYVYFPKEKVTKYLGRNNFRSTLNAALIGVPLPLCSCGVIPAGLGLKKDGASDGAAVGFLISTPQTGVDSLLVSASFLGWPFTIFKCVSALVMGLVGGAATEALHTDSQDAGRLEDAAAPQSTVGFFEHMVDVIRPIWRWIVFGVVASAAIPVWIPPGAMAGWSEINPALSGLAALAVAVPLYQQIVVRAYRDWVKGYVPNAMLTDANEMLMEIWKE